MIFGLCPFLWSKLAIFDFDGHFHPSDGGKDRQDSAHSCPPGWRRLPQKKSVRATKLFDVPLKVWDASLAITMYGHHFEGFLLWKILIWPFVESLFNIYIHLWTFHIKKVKIISGQATNNKQKTQNIALSSDKVVNKTPQIIHNHQILPVSTKDHQWRPEIPNNQPTCTTNMVLSHFLHRLWVLRKRKVLKSNLHCICKIFISPGNSSGKEIRCFLLNSILHRNTPVSSKNIDIDNVTAP